MTLTSLKQLPGVLALLALACSDSPPPAAQGAAHLVLTTSGCSTGAVSWVIPEGAAPTNETLVGDQIADGSNGATVACKVAKSASGGYVISASVETTEANFSISGTLDPGGLAFEGTGIMTFYSGVTNNLKGDSCTLSINATQAEKSASGKVWGNFQCPLVKVTSQASSGCSAQGSFVFGNCSE
jgi:hypothetical protein